MPIVRKVVPAPAPPPPPAPDEIRAAAIERLLARGLTLADIQAEEERAVAHHAVCDLRARTWSPKPPPPPTRTKVAAPPAPPTTETAPAAPPKARYRVRNWKEYNRALTQRASLTLWIEDDTLQHWCGNTRAGLVGAPTTYTDTAILAALTLRSVFRLPLRQTEGFVASLLRLLGVDLPTPDYSTLSRRSHTLEVVLPRATPHQHLHVVIDSTGLKVYGDGEWKTRQHGTTKRRTWRKMHLAIDEATGEILAVITTERSVGDCEVLPRLLESITEPIAQVSADGAYDTIACHQAIEAKGARPAIPPREHAAISDWGWWDAREDAVRRIEEVGRAEWKKEVNYHRRSVAETMMGRMKGTFGERLAGRRRETQTTEVRIRCRALNRMSALGLPDSVRVAA